MTERFNSAKSENNYGGPWGEVEKAADKIANDLVIEHVAGDARPELVFEMEDIFDRYETHVSPNERKEIISRIELPVASKATDLLRQTLEAGGMNPVILEQIRDFPVSIDSLRPHLDALFMDSIEANESLLYSGNSEDAKYVKDLSALTGNFGILQHTLDGRKDGSEFKIDQVRHKLSSIRKVRNPELRFEQRAAVDNFTRTAYALL